MSYNGPTPEHAYEAVLMPGVYPARRGLSLIVMQVMQVVQVVLYSGCRTYEPINFIIRVMDGFLLSLINQSIIYFSFSVFQ
jgi:hypothetical protein